MDPRGVSLSEDLLIEILKRLRVKSLLRFTCVSKQWSRLIKDPDLGTSHLQFNKSSSSVLGVVNGLVYFKHKELEHQLEHFRIDNTDETTTTTSEHLKIRFPWRPNPDPTKDRPFISILGHCNGLVLAYDAERNSVYEHTKTAPRHVRVSRYIIFNPIARRFKILPKSDIELPYLTFNDNYYENRSPGCKRSTYGLGFIDNLVYKVVRVTYGFQKGSFKEYDPARAEVYDSRSGRWREVPVNAGLSYEDLERGVYNSFDGCLYWFGRGDRKGKTYFILVSFHLVDEIWRETLLPYVLRSWTRLDYEGDHGGLGVYGICEHVGILGESVVMLVGDWHDELVWNVWKMNKEDDRKVSWTHMYKFDFEGTPLGFCRDGRLLLRKGCGSLFLHDSRKMGDARLGFTDLGCYTSVLVHDFVESLVLLDGECLVVEDDFGEEDEDLGSLFE